MTLCDQELTNWCEIIFTTGLCCSGQSQVKAAKIQDVMSDPELMNSADLMLSMLSPEAMAELERQSAAIGSSPGPLRDRLFAMMSDPVDMQNIQRMLSGMKPEDIANIHNATTQVLRKQPGMSQKEQFVAFLQNSDAAKSLYSMVDAVGPDGDTVFRQMQEQAESLRTGPDKGPAPNVGLSQEEMAAIMRDHAMMHRVQSTEQ